MSLSPPVVDSNLKRSMDSPSLSTMPSLSASPLTPQRSHKKRACCRDGYRTPSPVQTTTCEGFHYFSPPPTPRGCRTVLTHFFLDDDATFQLLALPELAPARRPLQETRVNMPSAFPLFPDPTYLKPRSAPIQAFYEEHPVAMTPPPLYPRSLSEDRLPPRARGAAPRASLREDRDEAPPQDMPEPSNGGPAAACASAAHKDENEEEKEESNKASASSDKKDHNKHGVHWRPTMPHVNDAEPKVHQYARCA